MLLSEETRQQRPQSSRLEKSNNENVAILQPPKQQSSDFRQTDGKLVNQSVSSVNSRSKSKWQNQFRSRSKTKSLISNKSRNQGNLTDRESTHSNGINMKRDMLKSKSFVNTYGGNGDSVHTIRDRTGVES